MLSQDRKEELSDLADAVSNAFCSSTISVEPHIIAEQSGITYSYGYYANSFDGLLEHRSGKFHIYINLDRLTNRQAPRARFTFAHEIAHYYIDEHRNALLQGLVPVHPSFNHLYSTNPVEREADYFASCLLMPEYAVREFCEQKELSSLLFEAISIRFKTSISSVIFRCFALEIKPMCIVMTIDGKIDWVMRTSTFHYGNAPGRGTRISNSTLVGEYFMEGTTYATEQIVFGNDWFNGFRAKAEQQFFEKCYYQPSSNKVMSVIWKNPVDPK